jgi:CHASE2 domain-containing sensor protein
LTNQPDQSDPCQTPFSLSFRIAYNYLQQEKNFQVEIQEGDDYLQFNQQSPKFKLLAPHIGGYQKLTQGEIGGFQVLLNYRATDKIAQEVSLSQVLNNEINPNWVIDRVVLIGYTATSVNDIHSTPINSEMPGVIIHAHMVSQILSAVLDGRSLLWTWHWWGDFLWVWGWSLLGGVLIWFTQRLFLLVLTEGVVFIALPVLCLIILIKGGWMPLLPSVGALVFTVGSLLVYIIYPTWRQN